MNLSLEQIKDVNYINNINKEYYSKILNYEVESLYVLKNNFKNNINFGLYLKNHDEIIGYIYYQLFDLEDFFKKADTCIGISDIYIEEKYRGLGLSSFLFNQEIITNYLKEKLPLNNYNLISFIDIENKSSLISNLKSDFKIFKEEKDMYGKNKNAYVLIKSLDNSININDIIHNDLEIKKEYQNIEIKKNENKYNIDLNIDFKIPFFEHINFYNRFKVLNNDFEFMPIDKKFSTLNFTIDNIEPLFIKSNKNLLSSMISFANKLSEDLDEDIYNYKGRLILKLDNIEHSYYPFTDIEILKDDINEYYNLECNNLINF